MKPEPRTRYNGSQSWGRFRALLETEFGLLLAHEPIETWTEIRGHNLHIDDWHPHGAPLGTLVIVHGGGGNGRVLAPFADAAATLGWRVLAPDLPGYGLTRPAPDFEWDYREWPEVVASLVDSLGGPTALMGLSVGGMTAVISAQLASKVAGVLVTTLLDMSQPSIFVNAARWRWLGALSLIGFRTTPWLIDHVRLPLRFAAPMSKMSGNPAMNAYFERDPLLGSLRAPARFFRTMHDHGVADPVHHFPIWLAHPGADRWTPTALSRGFFQRLTGEKRFRELSNGAHLPLEQPAFSELKEEMSHFLSSLL